MRRFRTIFLRLICVTFFSMMCMHSYADSFDTFGDHDKLRGQVVLAAGNISEFSAPQFSQNNSLQSPKGRFYQISNFCFTFNPTTAGGINSSLAGEAALLLIDKAKNTSLAQFDTSISQIKINLRSVILYDCASIIKSERDDLQQQGNDLKQQLELQSQKIRSMMERLKQQQQ